MVAEARHGPDEGADVGEEGSKLIELVADGAQGRGTFGVGPPEREVGLVQLAQTVSSQRQEPPKLLHQLFGVLHLALGQQALGLLAGVTHLPREVRVPVLRGSVAAG